MCVKLELASCNNFQDMRGPKFTLGLSGAAPAARPLVEKL